ncbi:hypothetical protein GSI_11763 [Ganoderma sinense ZZ0214-1]|uniref:Uncharacterized protein n=1 Tax=Ganoderma sinense ZZ0214-1 TaxID=1077348 RepID=A0A2G8RWW2_9APHY|nr:hypothetical protein GSI_11763 [Ganoderma sinense ZZ0214-1]
MVREIRYIRVRRGLCWPPVGWSVSCSLALSVVSSSVPFLPVFQSFYPRTGLRNMQWLILGRETALTIGTITAIIAQAMGELTINLSVGGVFTENIFYGHLAVASGVSTILSLPLILLYDMAQERSYCATVLFEVIWMLALVILWVVTGVKTTSVTGGTFKDCSAFSAPTQATLFGLCGDAQTLVLFSFITAGILGAYALALTGVAVSSASSGKSIWTHYPIPGAKKH